MAGIMDRTLAGDRIKTAGVRTAQVLNLPGQQGQGLFNRSARHPGHDLPGGAAGRTSQYLQGRDAVFLKLDPVFRQTELLAVTPEAAVVSQAAAGERGQGVGGLFTCGDNGNILFVTDGDQVMGKIGMFQVVKDQVRKKIIGDVDPWIINKSRQGFLDIHHPDDLDIPGKIFYSGYFLAAGTILFKNNNPHGLLLLNKDDIIQQE